jgi:hypothetical protein
MKKLTIVAFMSVLALMITGPAGAYVYQDNFETGWTGNYAPGWALEGYRWGAEPVAFMGQTTTHYSGSSGMKLTMDSVPDPSQFWGAIVNTTIPLEAMQKQYNPYMKVMYYDELGSTMAGQLYAVPSLVSGTADWTDIQFGARYAAPDNYYYHAAAVPNPPWGNSGVTRTSGWHELMFQLLNADGKVHFFVDGVEVGTSVRSDLTDLGDGILAVMFQTPLGGWGENKPYAIFDNYEVGSTSTVPLPPTALLLGSGLLGLVGLGWRRSRKES